MHKIKHFLRYFSEFYSCLFEYKDILLESTPNLLGACKKSCSLYIKFPTSQSRERIKISSARLINCSCFPFSSLTEKSKGNHS